MIYLIFFLLIIIVVLQIINYKEKKFLIEKIVLFTNKPDISEIKPELHSTKIDSSMEKMLKQFEEDWTPELLTEEKIEG